MKFLIALAISLLTLSNILYAESFDRLQAESMNLANDQGPQKGFYLQVTNKCKKDMLFAFVIPANGSRDNILTMLYYQPELIQAWKVIPAESTEKIFVDRMLTEKFYMHARNDNVFWGKDKKFDVIGPHGKEAFIFSEYKAEEKCTYEGVVICKQSYSCN